MTKSNKTNGLGKINDQVFCCKFGLKSTIVALPQTTITVYAKNKEMWILFHHNLQSIMKRNHDDGFLKIEAVKVVEREVRFDSDYLKRLFPNINWETLLYASKTLGYHELPEETPDASFLDSEDFLKKFHHALFELHLEEGAMVCAQSDRRFRIEAGRVKVEMTSDDDKSKESKRKEPPSNEDEWDTRKKKAVTCINCGFEVF